LVQNFQIMKQQTSAVVEPAVKVKNSRTFSNQPLCVGLDVHKMRWQVAVVDDGFLLSNASIAAGFDHLMHHLHKRYPGVNSRFAYESGPFGYTLCRQLQQAGFECLVVNPADIPGTDKDRKNKRDHTDARRLADNLSDGRLRGVYIPSPSEAKHRSLIRFRKRLWGDLVRCKNRLKGELLFQGIIIPAQYDNAHWSHNFLAWIQVVARQDEELGVTLLLMLEEVRALRQLLLKTEQALRDMMRSARYRDNANLLRSIPGIGPLTTMLILLEIGDTRRFASFDHLNSFVGLCPDSHQSGDTHRPQGLTGRRHNLLRSALIESSWQTIRQDPAMYQAYRQLCTRMKGQEAITRIARRLLRRVRAVLITQQPYLIGNDGSVPTSQLIIPDMPMPKKKGRPVKNTTNSHGLP
jgi:transposase